jgi:ribose transport system substrate-binding protein
MKNVTRAHRRGRIMLAALSLTAGLALAACSTVSSTSSPAATASIGATQQAVLQSGFSGELLQKPTAAGPAAQRGKNVWVVSCGQAYQACAQLSSSFVAAGKQLGWHTTLVDGKANPAVATTAIMQAVAAHANGIAVFSFDCPGVKSGLMAAKSAKIPVVQYTSIDCNDPAFGSGQPLYTAGLNVMGSTQIKDYYLKWGAARAEYAAALMGGKGKLLEIADTDQRTQQYSNQGFEGQFKKSCPACTLVKVPFTFSQVPHAATAEWSSALLQNPDATAVAFGIDSLMSLGLQSVLKQANFHGIVAGGEGLNLDLVRAGAQDTETVIPYGLAAWGLADTLNRVFAGANPATLPTEGGGWEFIDKDHNLPKPGQAWQPAFNYQQTYTSMGDGRG